MIVEKGLVEAKRGGREEQCGPNGGETALLHKYWRICYLRAIGFQKLRILSFSKSTFAFAQRGIQISEAIVSAAPPFLRTLGLPEGRMERARNRHRSRCKDDVLSPLGPRRFLFFEKLHPTLRAKRRLLR